jgi:hypothetical protein
LTEFQIKNYSETFVAVINAIVFFIFMKVYFTLAVLTAGGFLSGCMSGQNRLILDTVGPALNEASATTSTNGILLVYSAYRRNADFNALDSRRPEYSDYKIFAADGTLLQHVQNNSGTVLQDPVPVALPPGKYTVIARANGYGFVTVPVLVAAQQTTVLHLEGGDPWPGASGFNQTNAVRLPDGRVIGWKNGL